MEKQISAKNHLCLALVLIFSVLPTFRCPAEKFEDTHYRFACFANFEILNKNAKQYDGKNGYKIISDESEDWKFSSDAPCFDPPLYGDEYGRNVFYRKITRKMV